MSNDIQEDKDKLELEILREKLEAAKHERLYWYRKQRDV